MINRRFCDRSHRAQVRFYRMPFCPVTIRPSVATRGRAVWKGGEELKRRSKGDDGRGDDPQLSLTLHAIATFVKQGTMTTAVAKYTRPRRDIHSVPGTPHSRPLHTHATTLSPAGSNGNEFIFLYRCHIKYYVFFWPLYSDIRDRTPPPPSSSSRH